MKFRAAIFSSVIALPAFAGSDHSDLQHETSLHVADAPTGYTLASGEFIYNQSLQGLPIPSWMWIGVTDWLTVELDILPILGGLAIEPYLPIPSINARALLAQSKNWSLALEMMYQRQWRPLDQVTGANESEQPHDDQPIQIWRYGPSFYAHLNGSVQLARFTYLHGFVGATWQKHFRVNSLGQEPMKGVELENLQSPDYGLGLEWQATPYLALIGSASYGSTFTYMDNVPRKEQGILGFRVAPCLSCRWTILNRMRIEAVNLYMHFADADTWLILPVPIFPYFYWHFDW